MHEPPERSLDEPRQRAFDDPQERVLDRHRLGSPLEPLVPRVIEIDPELQPLDAFRAVAPLPHPFFLDSAAHAAMPSGIAEFSIVGGDPFATIGARDGDRGDPFGALGHAIDSNRLVPAPDLPFCGGAVGYLGYDLCHFVERLPRTVARDITMPDMFFGLYDVAAVFDHRRGRAFVVSNGLPQAGEARERRARSRAEWMMELLSTGNRSRRRTADAAGPVADVVHTRPVAAISADSIAAISANPNGPASKFSKADYLRAVERAREYIFAGDIYQVNLSQRLEVELRADPVALYESLRAISPAPFGAYIDAGEVRILSNSPERFLRRAGPRVETRPIKGTRPRSQDPANDRALAAELLASEKDAAEHLMIVDLERNDLGKICEYGSVVVEELARLESYRTVHHLVSIIAGELRPDASTADLLRAVFPGGSITGAPKVRAMEIIDELEPTSRGVYTGAIGHFSFCGVIDLNIAIRTLIHDGTKAYFQVGGGIVADSDPAAEYDETLDKAQAFLAVLSNADAEVIRE